MATKEEIQILENIKEYNQLMKNSIEGPNCIDPKICRGDCCHIHIDIPKILVEYYLDNNLATIEDFERGNIFSFRIAVRASDSKCVFYCEEINGCKLHFSGMKPPQCWIYPTGFSNEETEDKKMDPNGTIACKKIGGWRINDEKKTQKASELLKIYTEFSESEFINENISKPIKIRLENLKEKLIKCAPKEIAGIQDSYSEYQPLSAEGFCLRLKKHCEMKENAHNCSFFSCNKICDLVAKKICEDLPAQLLKYIEKNGPKKEYSFFELWS